MSDIKLSLRLPKWPLQHFVEPFDVYASTQHIDLLRDMGQLFRSAAVLSEFERQIFVMKLSDRTTAR